MTLRLDAITVFKIIYCSVCFFCFSYYCISTIFEYREFKTRTEIENIENELPEFPAITIYNRNRFRKTAFTEWANSVGENDKTFSSFKNYIKFNATPEEIRASGHTFEKMVTLCDHLDSCRTPMWSWDPDKGNIYTLIEPAHPFRNETEDLEINYFKIDFDTGEYVPEKLPYEERLVKPAVLLMIHDAEEYYNPELDVKEITISPRMYYDITVTAHVHTSLKQPYWPKCYDYRSERKRNDGKGSLSRNNCIIDCEKKFFADKCGCNPAIFRISQEDKNVCRKSMIEIGNCAAGLRYDEVLKLCQKRCPVNCRRIEFEIHIRDYEPEMPYDHHPLNQKYYGYEVDEELSNYTSSLVQIRFKEKTYSLYSLQPRITGRSLAVSIGGFLGLWLGMGLLQVPMIVAKAILLRNYLQEGEKSEGPEEKQVNKTSKNQVMEEILLENQIDVHEKMG